MKALNQDGLHVHNITIHQFVLNMLGDASDPLKLTGSVIDEEEYLSTVESMQSGVQDVLVFQIMKSMLCNFLEILSREPSCLSNVGMIMRRIFQACFIH